MHWNIVLALLRWSPTVLLIANTQPTANALPFIQLYHYQNEKISALYPRLCCCSWESSFHGELSPLLLDKIWSWTQVRDTWHECLPVMCSGGSLLGFVHSTQVHLWNSSPRSRNHVRIHLDIYHFPLHTHSLLFDSSPFSCFSFSRANTIDGHKFIGHLSCRKLTVLATKSFYTCSVNGSRYCIIHPWHSCSICSVFIPDILFVFWIYPS